MRRLLSPLLLAALLLSSCDAPPGPGLAKPRARLATPSALPFINAHALIIIRHADISPADKARLGNAAPLLPRGTDRAQELITALKDAGITRIITSSSLRTQATAAPLATALHLQPETATSHGTESRAPHTPPPTNAQSIPTQATDHNHNLADHANASDNILVVYHHSIIPTILKNLGYEEGPIDDATEFDRVYVLLPNQKTHTYQLLRLRYGGTWPPPTNSH
jgi:broad specificity phosphatase PhoE